MKFLKTLSFVAFDNDFDTDERAWNPEIWATETLIVLESNLVIGQLVHRDFSEEIASFGDTVNTRKPGEFTAKRKGTNDDVEVQSATAVKVPVVLNQHVHTSFLIRDGEEARSMTDLIDQYLTPAAKSLAEHIDKMLLGQVYQFLDNQYEVDPNGSDDIKDAMLDTRKIMNQNKVPVNGRNLILTTATETEALKLDLFLSAEKVGDEGTALREASLGRKLGFDTFMCQNTPSILSDGGSTTGTTNAAGSTDGVHLAGSTVITLTTDSSAILTGMYIKFSTCGGIYRVTAGGAATEITIDRGVLHDVPDDSFITYYTNGAVDLAGDASATAYPIGYAKPINIAASGVIPVVGQLVGFADSDSDPVRTGEYSIVDVDDGSGAGDYYILLDRPLEAALEDTDVINYSPDKEYNIAFDRNAIAMVVRPLAQPRTGTGASSGVASFDGLAMRVTITYSGTQQGHLVTLDLLCGVKVLDEDRGAVMIRD